MTSTFQRGSKQNTYSAEIKQDLLEATSLTASI